MWVVGGGTILQPTAPPQRGKVARILRWEERSYNMSLSLFSFESLCDSFLCFNPNVSLFNILVYLIESKHELYIYRLINYYIYLSNANLENCGEVKGFGFIYILVL